MRIEYKISTPTGTVNDSRVSYQQEPPAVGEAIMFGRGPSHLVTRVELHPKSDRAVVTLRAPKHRRSL